MNLPCELSEKNNDRMNVFVLKHQRIDSEWSSKNEIFPNGKSTNFSRKLVEVVKLNQTYLNTLLLFIFLKKMAKIINRINKALFFLGIFSKQIT